MFSYLTRSKEEIRESCFTECSNCGNSLIRKNGPGSDFMCTVCPHIEKSEYITDIICTHCGKYYLRKSKKSDICDYHCQNCSLMLSEESMNKLKKEKQQEKSAEAENNNVKTTPITDKKICPYCNLGFLIPNIILNYGHICNHCGGCIRDYLGDLVKGTKKEESKREKGKEKAEGEKGKEQTEGEKGKEQAEGEKGKQQSENEKQDEDKNSNTKTTSQTEKTKCPKCEKYQVCQSKLAHDYFFCENCDKHFPKIKKNDTNATNEKIDADKNRIAVCSKCNNLYFRKEYFTDKFICEKCYEADNENAGNVKDTSKNKNAKDIESQMVSSELFCEFSNLKIAREIELKKMNQIISFGEEQYATLLEKHNNEIKKWKNQSESDQNKIENLKSQLEGVQFQLEKSQKLIGDLQSKNEANTRQMDVIKNNLLACYSYIEYFNEN
jgi:hypothetical protein